MTDIQALRTQEYSTNLDLLSQQMMPKLATRVIEQGAAGSKAFRMTSQIDKTDAVDRATSAQPIINIDVVHDGRWVYPTTSDWGKVVDDIDLLQTNISPQGAYVRSAVAALNRKRDTKFTTAYFGDAQTGETGSTTTSFDSNNVVAVTEGAGSATGLNVDKIRAGLEILAGYDVDLEMEKPILAVSPKQYYGDLMALTQVVSTDFNSRPVLVDGVITEFLGCEIVVSTLLPTDSNSYRRLPLWVPSGMGRGVWKEVSGTVRKAPHLQGEPDYVESSLMDGYTRLDEDKCIEIKCSEA